MILRPTSPSRHGGYQVVGTAFVYGLHDALSVLGPLPEPWSVHVYLDSIGNDTVQKFYNKVTGQVVEDDPRLPPLPGDWKRLNSQDERTADEPEIFQKFMNITTGEVINYDPRMSEGELRGKGLKLVRFELV